MKKLKPKRSEEEKRLIEELIKKVPADKMFGKDGYFNKLKEEMVSEMLKAEMSHHLGYETHEKSDKQTSNRRNGSYPRKVISGESTLEIEMPRDPDASFSPELLPKGVRRFEGFDEKVISMYARGMSTQEIQEHVLEIYGAQVSKDLISTVTDTVIEKVQTWSMRPLEAVYPIVFLDCLFIKARDSHTVINKAVYLAHRRQSGG